MDENETSAEVSELDQDNELENISLTHDELMKVTKSTLNELLKNDAVMNDLPLNVTSEEIEAQIAVLHGQSITIIVKRGENDHIPVIVKQKNSTVSDLKRAFKRALTLKLHRQGERCKIGWKYVWRVYCLSYNGCKLDSDHGFLNDYGIVNKSEVNFTLKVKEKNKFNRRH